jgi:hypothetical protein
MTGKQRTADDQSEQTEPAVDAEVTARREQQTNQYSLFRAKSAITHPNGAVAYDRNHPIQADNVDDDGRVALSRHLCHDHEDDLRCARFNEVQEWSEPGLAVRVEPK